MMLASASVNWLAATGAIRTARMLVKESNRDSDLFIVLLKDKWSAKCSRFLGWAATPFC